MKYAAIAIATGVLILVASAVIPPDLGSRAATNVGSPVPTYQLTVNRSAPVTGQLNISALDSKSAGAGGACAEATCSYTLARGDYRIAVSGDARVVSWGGACADGQ